MKKLPFRLLASLAIVATFGTGATFAGSPEIIAHRGDADDAPENTAIAIQTSLDNGADAIWVKVQQSKDGVFVLYRPSDLNSLTDKSGPISAYSAAKLADTDAGFAFSLNKGQDYPFRGKGVGIPRLEALLKEFPETRFYIDIKSPDADPEQLGQALLTTLEQTRSLLERTRVYSTDAKYLQALPPAIRRFEVREDTRTLLANVAMAHNAT